MISMERSWRLRDKDCCFARFSRLLGRIWAFFSFLRTKGNIENEILKCKRVSLILRNEIKKIDNSRCPNVTFKFRTDYSSHWTHLHLLGWLRKIQFRISFHRVFWRTFFQLNRLTFRSSLQNYCFNWWTKINDSFPLRSKFILFFRRMWTEDRCNHAHFKIDTKRSNQNWTIQLKLDSIVKFTYRPSWNLCCLYWTVEVRSLSESRLSPNQNKYFLLFNATNATLEVWISDKDKEDTDKNRNFENFVRKFNASPGHAIRELRSQRPTWGKQELLLTRFGHWVEHSSVAQKFQRLCFCLYLYLPKLLSLNLYMALLSFVMLLLN